MRPPGSLPLSEGANRIDLMDTEFRHNLETVRDEIVAGIDGLSGEAIERIWSAWGRPGDSLQQEPPLMCEMTSLRNEKLTAEERFAFDAALDTLNGSIAGAFARAEADPTAAGFGYAWHAVKWSARAYAYARVAGDRIPRWLQRRLTIAWLAASNPSSVPNASSRRPENSARKQNSSR